MTRLTHNYHLFVASSTTVCISSAQIHIIRFIPCIFHAQKLYYCNIGCNKFFTNKKALENHKLRIGQTLDQVEHAQYILAHSSAAADDHGSSDSNTKSDGNAMNVNQPSNLKQVHNEPAVNLPTLFPTPAPSSPLPTLNDSLHGAHNTNIEHKDYPEVETDEEDDVLLDYSHVETTPWGTGLTACKIPEEEFDKDMATRGTLYPLCVFNVTCNMPLRFSAIGV